MLQLLCIFLGIAVVSAIIVIAFLDWGDMAKASRISLVVTAAGLAWGGLVRFQSPVSIGDAIFLGGLLAYLCFSYGRRVFSHADAADGRQDGKIDLGAIAGRKG